MSTKPAKAPDYLGEEELTAITRYMKAVHYLAQQNSAWRTVYMKLRTKSVYTARTLYYFEHMERMAKKKLPAAVELITTAAKLQLLS